VPVLTSLLAARTASSGCRSSPSAIGTGLLRGSPLSSPGAAVPSLAIRALLRGLRLLRARLRREVPGFGAVLIARRACVTDRRAGLPADLRSVPRAGGRWRDSRRLGACSRPSGGSSHVFGCLLDREGSESPFSPQSLPVRVDPEGSRFRLSPHPVRPGFLPVPGGAESAPRGLGFLSPTLARRSELDWNPSGTCAAADEAGQAVPHLDRCGGPS
jgi:hypothetical protein